MPPWVAFVPRMTTLLRGKAIERLPISPRRCNVAFAKSSAIRIRSASTHVSPTSINVRPNIPPKNLELYDALSELTESAEAYVNLSRLQLALRGVAVPDAVTRVAVLGLNSQISAQRLARLLLADPLGAEEHWEKELDGTEDGAVLLRYGDESDAPRPTSLYKVLSIPSRVLRTHNLEILVSTLNINMSNPVISTHTESPLDSILVPKLQFANASGVPVPFPVHKTLILGENLDSAIAFGRFTLDGIGDAGNMVKVAIELPPRLEEVDSDANGISTPVNLDAGTKAIASFRESIQNSQIYERGWFRSGLPGLSKWLGLGLQPVEPIKPTMKALISSVVSDVETNVAKQDAARLQELALGAQQTATEPLVGHLEDWAEKSHTELRDQLDSAFSSRNWHKLSWWKLFWRVDDVTMIASEIIERRWLVDAEKNSIYLAGRMNQAGFPEDIQSLPMAILEEDASSANNASKDASQNQASATPHQKASTDISTDVRPPQPWPSQISVARTDLLADTIPPLQALAQRLVLSTLSTTSLSSALSALLYVSVSTVSIFEASAIAALGLTISLRRMQKLWEDTREHWQVSVREEGRRTLKKTEEMVRLIIMRHERPVIKDPGVKERGKAREAVEKVRRALGEL